MEITNYTVNELFSKFNIQRDENTDEALFVSIMNGNFNKEIDKIIDANILYNIGKYYQFIKQPDGYNYDLMKKCYLMAIEKGNNNALNNLGCYYRKEKDYENAKKYLTMAVENGVVRSFA